MSQGVLHAVSEDGKVLRVMADGSFFGEFALLANEPRSCSVVAQEHCDLFVLEKDLFEQAVRKYPSFEYHMNDIAKTRIGTQSPVPARRASIGETVEEAQAQARTKSTQSPVLRRASSASTGNTVEEAHTKSWGSFTG